MLVTGRLNHPSTERLIATARNPVLMASAMKQAVAAGRDAWRAGRMPKKLYSAAPSSPTGGLIGKT